VAPEGLPLPADPAAVLALLYRAAGAGALAEKADADLLRRFAAASGAAEAASLTLMVPGRPGRGP
jgi:hypothetical protein